MKVFGEEICYVKNPSFIVTFQCFSFFFDFLNSPYSILMKPYLINDGHIQIGKTGTLYPFSLEKMSKSRRQNWSDIILWLSYLSWEPTWGSGLEWESCSFWKLSWGWPSIEMGKFKWIWIYLLNGEYLKE